MAWVYGMMGNSLSMIFSCLNIVRKWRQLSPLLYNVCTDNLNHHLQANRCRFAWCLGKLTELCRWYGVTCTRGNCSSDSLGVMSSICWTSWHCIQHNEKGCMLVRPKQSEGQRSTRVRLENEELSFVQEFRYLRHVMTADCRDDKDIKKQFMRQNAVGNMLARKFSFAPVEAKIQLFKSYCYHIFGFALWRHSYQISIRKLTVSYSDTFNVLVTSPDTPALVWHLKWTQLIISMWCSSNLLTAWWAE